MTKNQKTLFSAASSLLLAGIVLAGCGGGQSAASTASTSSTATPKPVNFRPNSLAGIPLLESKPLNKKSLIASSKTGLGSRRDPFALTAAETRFEASQSSERFGSELGFSTEYVEPEDKDAELPVFEQQPYRRLCGVVVGDSVIGLLVMEDGHTELIRPGMKIPNSEWTVVSIDEEKAVLRRSGNKLPREITVRLESPPADLSGGANSGFGGAPTGGGPAGKGGFAGPGGGPRGAASGGGGAGRTD